MDRPATDELTGLRSDPRDGHGEGSVPAELQLDARAMGLEAKAGACEDWGVNVTARAAVARAIGSLRFWGM